jgi:putative RecB family exonuclease
MALLGWNWPWKPKANGHAALHAITETAPVAPSLPAPEDDLARTLSPSQVATFLDCSAKWWYKHGLHLPERRSAALHLGSAFHEAIMENFRAKVDTKADLPATGVRALFRASWAVDLDDVVFGPKENPDEMLAMGEVMIDAYMDQVAPRIEPAHVEQEVKGEIGGVKVRGRLDIIDVEGRIIDAKTAAKKPSGIAPNYRFQVATYAKLHSQCSGSARVDTVTKTKTIQVIEQSFAIEQSDLVQLDRMYPLAQEAMRSGLYMPNRNSNLCSRKHCPYADQCEADYGGQVE